jgi:single-strand DNA-binding protein
MFDTYLTVVGVVITNLDRRRVESTGTTVVNFRMASTSRRFDRESDTWTDRETLFLRVTCWRQLGENAYQSIYKGDPVVVSGRVYSRSFTAADGAKRWTYEMDASSVGHDLSRGVSSFVRNQRGGAADLSAVTSELVGTAEDALAVPEDVPDDLEQLAEAGADSASAGTMPAETVPAGSGDEERMVGAA